MQDNRPAIGIDCDGVLAAFSPRFIEMANARYRMDLRPEDQTDWDHYCLGLMPQQVDEIWRDIKVTKNWWMSLDPMPGTGSLAGLDDRYKLFFITSREPSAGLSLEDQTANWLRRNYFIANPTVIVCHNKGPLAAALNLKYFIDDRDKNCLEVRMFSPFTKVFIQDAPYNQDFAQGSVERVRSFNDFVQRIGGIDGSAKAQRAA